MRALAAALVLPVLAGCAAPIVYRDPAGRQIVDCTALARGTSSRDPDAPRAAAFPLPDASTGKDVPRLDALPAGTVIYDSERQCAQELKRAGWTCLSGCDGGP